MKTNNIIIACVAVVLIAVLVYVCLAMQSSPENNTSNDTINISLNQSNNTTVNQSTAEVSSKKSATKSDKPKVVSDELQYNYQADDGSYYRQVEYSDGNFRQIDTNGKIIGSSYENDHVEGPGMT